METRVSKIMSYDTYNQIPHDDALIGSLTTTIGMASLRTSWKIFELYEE